MKEHIKCRKNRFRLIEIKAIRTHLLRIIDDNPDFVYDELKELVERADIIDYKDELIERARE